MKKKLIEWAELLCIAPNWYYDKKMVEPYRFLTFFAVASPQFVFLYFDKFGYFFAYAMTMMVWRGFYLLTRKWFERQVDWPRCQNEQCSHQDNSVIHGCTKKRFKDQMDIGAGVSCNYYK